MNKALMILLLATLASSAALADRMTAMRAGCLGCHQPDKATIGPGMKAIAEKFGSDADVEALVAVVREGKTPEELTWGTIPMPASPASEADVRTVVQWMLTQ